MLNKLRTCRSKPSVCRLCMGEVFIYFFLFNQIIFPKKQLTNFFRFLFFLQVLIMILMVIEIIGRLSYDNPASNLQHLQYLTPLRSQLVHFHLAAPSQYSIQVVTHHHYFMHHQMPYLAHPIVIVSSVLCVKYK